MVQRARTLESCIGYTSIIYNEAWEGGKAPTVPTITWHSNHGVEMPIHSRHCPCASQFAQPRGCADRMSHIQSSACQQAGGSFVTALHRHCHGKAVVLGKPRGA